MHNKIKKRLLEELMAKMGGEDLKRSSKVPAIVLEIGVGQPMGGGMGEEDENEGEQLEMGEEVEMEHTQDEETAEKIARDHLVENPNYYTKLKEAGLADELDGEDEDEEEDDEDEGEMDSEEEDDDLDPRLKERMRKRLQERLAMRK